MVNASGSVHSMFRMADKYGTYVYITLLYMLVYSGMVMSQEPPKPYLNLIGSLPMTGERSPGGPACLPAASMAVEMVNNRSDILANYTLRYLLVDDQCDPGSAVDVMYKMLYTPPVKHFISGPGCSIAAGAAARSSYKWNITHLSWGAASPMLSNKKLYPTLFRCTPSDAGFNTGRLALLRHFNWKKVALINVAVDYFFAVNDHMVRLIMEKAPDVHIISQEIFNQDPTSRIQYLKLKDTRIIFAGGYENHGRLMLCAAYHACLYGPNIVWVFPGSYTNHWWRTSHEGLECTREQMDEAAEGHLLTEVPYYIQEPEVRGISGLNVQEFMENVRKHEYYNAEYEKFSFIIGRVFDSIWGAALALDCAVSHLQEIGHVKTLDQFEYSDSDIGDIVWECTRTLKYIGIGGRYDFTKDDPQPPTIIRQVIDSEATTVAIYKKHFEDVHTHGKGDWRFDWINGGLKWRGGYVPRDSTQVTVVEKSVPVYLYAIMSSLASCGILTSLILFLFNVRHREHVQLSVQQGNADGPRIVKLSSPNINNVMLIGCVCTYCTVFMQSYTSETLALCYVRISTFTLGFTTVFGALFSKTWRVYRIFATKNPTRLRIKDRQLVGIVGAMLTAIVAFLLVRYTVDPLFMETLFLPNEVHMSGNDAEIRPFLRRCVSRYESYFSWTINITEGVLLVFGAFLSFETRKVHITALNDSRLIGFCLYNVIGMATIGLTLTLALETQVALVYGITSGFTTLGTTSTQLIVFIPKIMAVYYPHHVEQGDEPSTSRSVVSKTITSRLNVPGATSSTALTTSSMPSGNSSGADNVTPQPGTSYS